MHDFFMHESFKFMSEFVDLMFCIALDDVTELFRLISFI